MRRRTYLATATGATAAAMAGCTGFGNSDSGSDDEPSADDGPSPLEEPDEAGTVDDERAVVERALAPVEETHDIGFASGYPVQGRVVDSARYPRVVDPDVEEADEVLERTAELGRITTLCYYDLDDDAADDLEVVLPQILEREYVIDGGAVGESTDGAADDGDENEDESE